MTHQIPPHLAFCTPGKNKKVEQGTNPETPHTYLKLIPKNNSKVPLIPKVRVNHGFSLPRIVMSYKMKEKVR